MAPCSADRRGHLDGPTGRVGVGRVVDQPESHPGPEVVAHLVNGSVDSSNSVVRHLNSVDAVVVQHEYGIYGGPDGSDVPDILEALTVPTILALHPALAFPPARQRHSFGRIVLPADVAVTMTDTAPAPQLPTAWANPPRARGRGGFGGKLAPLSRTGEGLGRGLPAMRLCRSHRGLGLGRFSAPLPRSSSERRRSR